MMYENVSVSTKLMDDARYFSVCKTSITNENVNSKFSQYFNNVNIEFKDGLVIITPYNAESFICYSSISNYSIPDIVYPNHANYFPCKQYHGVLEFDKKGRISYRIVNFTRLVEDALFQRIEYSTPYIVAV